MTDCLKFRVTFTLLLLLHSVANAQFIHRFAGTGYGGYSGDGGSAIAASTHLPIAGTSDTLGNIYIADRGNHRIRKVTPAGIITTVAGTGYTGYTGDGGQATDAQLNNPSGVAVDAAGNIYIGDTYNSCIRKVDVSGIITTIAGTGIMGLFGDGGLATSAQLGLPNGLLFDSAGNLFFADEADHVVRKITPAGIIKRVAGNGLYGYTGDGGPATSARMTSPTGLAFDTAGNLYITDPGYGVIRKVSTSGIITTVAGNGTFGFSGDGGPATAASLSGTYGVAIDDLGNLYIADHENRRIRIVSPSGIINSFAGGGMVVGDGGPPTAAIVDPSGVYVDRARNVYIFEVDSNRVRRVDSIYMAPIVGSDSVCEAASISLNDVTVGGTWSSASPAIATVGSSSGIVTGISAGTATISYTRLGGSLTKSVTVNPLPVPGTIYGLNNVCIGSTILLVDAVGAGIWSSSSPAVATISTSGTVTGVATGISIISYSVTNYCGTLIDTSIVTVDMIANAGTIAGPSYLCVGSTVTLTNTAIGGVWSSLRGNTAVSDSVVTGVITGVDSIVYSVTNACGTVSTYFPITVYSTYQCDSVAGVNTTPASSPCLVIYPNPTYGIFTVQAAISGRFIIYTMLGQQLEAYNIHNSKVDLQLPPHLPSGIYLCKFISDDGSLSEEHRLVYTQP